MGFGAIVPNMPDVILRRIFDFLTYKELCRLECICKRWRKLIWWIFKRDILELTVEQVNYFYFVVEFYLILSICYTSHLFVHWFIHFWWNLHSIIGILHPRYLYRKYSQNLFLKILGQFWLTSKICTDFGIHPKFCIFSNISIIIFINYIFNLI